MPHLTLTIRHETAADADAIEHLHERAFGPGRYARTASRLRETGVPHAPTCFVAFVATMLVGSVRVTRIHAGDWPALMLGPLAVEPAFEGRGIGAALMRAAIQAARDAGETLVFLVGDEPYYKRFGFRRVPPGTVNMPGPVNPDRFLVLELQSDAMATAKGVLS
ncbi:MAG: GNAT family N-acetyltransferase [Beijerinckiaceae bacterium]